MHASAQGGGSRFTRNRASRHIGVIKSKCIPGKRPGNSGAAKIEGNRTSAISGRSTPSPLRPHARTLSLPVADRPRSALLVGRKLGGSRQTIADIRQVRLNDSNWPGAAVPNVFRKRPMELMQVRRRSAMREISPKAASGHNQSFWSGSVIDRFHHTADIRRDSIYRPRSADIAGRCRV